MAFEYFWGKKYPGDLIKLQMQQNVNYAALDIIKSKSGLPDFYYITGNG